MGALELLVIDAIVDVGVDTSHIRTGTKLELPGYYRSEKRWDLLVVADGHLVAAIEFKSQVGPSFGNNANNRSEEAIGSAEDIWTAYREGRFGSNPPPFIGYFFLLEDCARVHGPVGNKQPYFPVDPAFTDASYAMRYALLCERLMLERKYSATCLTLATNEASTRVSHPSPALAFRPFIAALTSHVRGFLEAQA